MSGLVLASRYELQQQIAEGPIFTVWSAIDRIGPKDVSLRLLASPFHLEPEFHQALREVADQTKGIRHPSFERMTELEVDNDRVFLIGDVVKGMSLVDRIKKLAPFSAPVAVSTTVSLCEGLCALHRSNVVHGDVGAHNVRVLAEGSAIIQQAGLWRAYSSSRTAGPTVLPQMAAYLAPEVSQGELPSMASDVYGVGVILFQLLTGRLPYTAEQPVALAMKHVTEATPSVRDLNPGVPVALAEITSKALAKSRHDRYANAVDLLSDLRVVQDAMRFGRSLSWPLVVEPVKAAESEAEAPSTGSSNGRPVKRIESKRGAPKPQAPKVEDPTNEVPTWLKGVLVFFASLIVMMVGAWMVFNLKKPRLVTAPDLNRLSIANAQAQLEPLKLKLKVTKRVFDEKIPADTIIDMDPTPGERIYEGGVINVKVSSGSRFVEVPDLRGMTIDKAKILLDSLELKLDSDVGQERSKDVEKGMIMKQVPEARGRVERRTMIRATVSSGRTAPPVKDDGTKYLYSIRIELNDITDSVIMRVDMTDSRNTRTISEQRREPGEIVEMTAEGYGPQAIFKIFYDGEPVTQVTKRADGEEESE